MGKMTTPIKAVLFDYGMVLSGPPDPAARAEMERLIGVDAAQMHQLYWKYRDAYDRGTLSGVAYWNAIASDLHQVLDPSRLKELIAADNAYWTQPNQPMIDWARSLHRAGIRTGILSNIGDAMEVGILARFPWLVDFSHHTFSHRLGIAKPDPAIYAHAIAGLGVSPAEILFIDDREENILGARAAGMLAIQYSNHKAFMVEMRRLGLKYLLDLLEE
jgi:putative hydrolase of the HAD superfamily